MVKTTKNAEKENKTIETVSISDPGWSDYVLSKLMEDEKIAGNPTTDGLRRIFETVLNCKIVAATSRVVQTPEPNNEKRATVCHSITYRLNPDDPDTNGIYMVTVDGSADVYWGNCDKIFRNHPVAVAETRAEGRALRRALRLKKVVAEELAENIEDNVDGVSANKISSNQINFIDVISKRLNINVKALLQQLDISYDSIYNIQHEQAVQCIQKLNFYQQNIAEITDIIMGYQENWK
jgi:hypothetical protein